MDTLIEKPTSGKTLTPTMPSEPPPEMKALEFTAPPVDMMGEVGTAVTVDHKEIKETPTEPVKSEEAKPAALTSEQTVVAKKDEKKTEVKSVLKPPTEKKDEQKKEVVTEKVTVKPITPVKDGKTKEEADTFDYTKYPAVEHTNMKNMSRQSREAYAKLLDENKNLSSLKDSTYLQHEQAYTLSPDFRNLQVKNHRATIEAQCWKQALLATKRGEDIQEITGFDENHNPIMSKPHKPTDEDEIRINNNLLACANATREFSGQLQQFPNQFKQRIQADQQAIQQYEKEHFAWVNNPELLEHTVEVEGAGERKVKDIISDVKNMFPVYERNSVGARMAAHLAVGLIIRNAELKEARNTSAVSQIEQQERIAAEPSSDHREVGTTTTLNGVPKEFSVNSNIAEQLGIR